MADGSVQVAEVAQQISRLEIESNYTLAGFFPVMYELLSQYMTGCELLALELTCSKGIITRLRRAQIRRFWIGPLEAPNWSISGFGALCYYKSLTSFTIHNSMLPVMKKGPVLFEKLPPTIRHLSLRIPYLLGTWLLIKPPSSLRSPTKAVKKSKRAVVDVDISKLTLQLFSEPQDFNMASLFPQLTIIEISGGISYASGQGRSLPIVSSETAITTTENFVRSLPRTFMQRVSLPGLGENTWRVLVPSLSVLKAMPGSRYKSLSPQAASSALDQAKTLPDTLQELDLHVHDLEVPWDALYELPSSLTRLKLDFSLSGFPEINTSESTSFFSRLPPTLTELLLDLTPRPSYYDNNIFRSFILHPIPSLTRLSLNLQAAGAIESWIIEAMPRTLTDLKISGYLASFSGLSSLAKLPPYLKIFTFNSTATHYAPRIPYLGYLDMPQSIEELELGSSFGLTDAVFAALPRALTSLVLTLSSMTFENHVCTTTCFRRCRQEIERLVEFSQYLAAPGVPPSPHPSVLSYETLQYALYNNLEGLTDDELAYGRELRCLTDDGAAYGLPPHIVSLTFNASSFGPRFFQALDHATPQLGRLSFTTDQILPQASLSSLSSSSAFTSLHISNTPYLCPTALKFLPPTLTYLYVDDARFSVPDTAPSFKRDEERLKREGSLDEVDSLSWYSTSITNEILAALPRSLVTLHLTKGSELTDDSVDLLPESLTSLTLAAAASFTTASLSSLPRPLNTLKVAKMIMPHPRPSRASILASIPQALQVGELPWFTSKNRKVDFSTLP